MIGPTSPFLAAIHLRQAQETVRRHPQVDARGADCGLHGPAANEGSGPNLAEFEHAQRGFMRAKLTRKGRRNEEQQGCPHQSERRHCSYRTV